MKKSHIAGWASDSPTPAQLAELFRQIQNGRVTKKKLQAFLRRGVIFKNEDIARKILGDDIIFPDEIAEACGLSYSEEQLKRLADVLPSEDVLRWCKANNYVVAACPPKPMSLLEVRSLKPDIFYSKSGGWYVDQEFAQEDKTSFGWLAIRKDIVPKSQSKNWDEQLRLLAGEELVPNAGEFAWFITTYYEVRGVRLFERIYARTSSVDSGGDRVYVGNFDSEGLGVNDDWDDSRSDYLGVSSARKF